MMVELQICERGHTNGSYKLGAGDQLSAAVRHGCALREPAQIAVSSQYEPWAAHAAQRHSGLHRIDGGRRLWWAILCS